MAVAKKVFGNNTDGKEIMLYSITNSKGMKAEVMNYGAILVNLFVPSARGEVADVVLGYDRVEEYFENGSFFGATIGPSANRIGGAKFSIDGVTYQLAVNDGANNLHSDAQLGYHKRMYDVVENADGISLSIEDTDGSMGFPGNKKICVTYTVTEDNELKIHYHVTSDKNTVINMTNHSYFNLAGQGVGNIHDHVLQMNASNYTEILPGAIPTGKLVPVQGTPFDFTKAKRVGEDIAAKEEQLTMVKGYDHNWVIDGADGTVKQIATVTEPTSGRVMEVFTDLPGVQFYAGNCITPQTGKSQKKYESRSGLCLETQFYPDTPNKPQFPSAVFGPDRAYDTTTIYRFR